MATFPHFICANLICALLPVLGCTQTSSQADFGAPVSTETDTDNLLPVEDAAFYGFEIGNEVNSQNSPVVNMWGPGFPSESGIGGGYHSLDNAEHALIFSDAVDAGGYNHHAHLFHANGKFYGSWSNHSKGEDAAGQRVLYASSEDGVNWTHWEELFPQPDEIKEWENGFGFYSVAGDWFVVDDELYATAQIFEFTGWENADKSNTQLFRDKDHYFRVRERYGYLCRKVSPDGTLGPVFALSSRANGMKGLAYDFTPYGQNEAYDKVADAIRDERADRARFHGPMPKPIDTARLVEPANYKTTDGVMVSILRDDRFSHRKYMSYSLDDGKTWSTALPTDIPDSPSLDMALTAPDGSILLIGNHCATAFDNPSNPRHYKRDILDIAVSPDGYFFDQTFVIKSGEHQWRVPPEQVRARGGGPQYPDALIVGDYLYVMYSSGKEDIWCSRVALADLLD
ncbi:MAG: exo-alpha-sialidase [Verrucomicrobiota bacterium JB024]|nr:exo-alpha-sialidase [Verrucomicrobiota bacterium JB024]